MANVIFELKDVHFSYMGKYPALSGIDMTIDKGEKRAIIGANGSGKSTLLHLLDGLLFPGRGTITAFGKDVNERAFSDQAFSRDFRRRIGFLFQNPDVQLFCPSVKEEILFGPLALRENKIETKKRFDQLIDTLSIEELLDRPPHQLSIGEKRKVAIASTLIIDPEVLLLDEPTAGLDPLTARHIIDLLVRENASGKTIITSTHDLHIIEEIADTVSVFSRDKKLVKSGPSLEILKDIELLQTHNLVHIHAHRHDGRSHVHSHEHPSHNHTH